MNLNDTKAKAAFFARTMHTPDDPARAARRNALRDFSRVLIPLHRLLIDAARDEYTASHNPIAGPGHLLQMLGEDPFFAWLKPMTTLIVDVDEMARVDFEDADVEAIAERAEALFGGVEPSHEFAAKYLEILQRNAEVAISHAALRKALAALRN